MYRNKQDKTEGGLHIKTVAHVKRFVSYNCYAFHCPQNFHLRHKFDSFRSS